MNRYYTIAFLILINLIVFGQTITFEFVDYDDRTYILDNPQMEEGLSWSTVKWGLTTGYFVSWHPVTWWSYLLDAELYGLNPGGFHATNVIIHILATIFLFYALFRMTERYWESLIVAVLFAIHPQHVQSVAWVAERKDVLSALFMSLTFLAYHRYTLDHRVRWYLATMFMFALGLMSKSMLVTLPCVLFLLDYWPLNRLGDAKAIVRAVLEKIPLMGLSIATALITYIAQNDGGATTSLEKFGVLSRLSNVVNGYAIYLYRTVWPANLSFFYPLDIDGIPIVNTIVCSVVLLVISLLVWKNRRTAPQWVTGWLWYLGTLVPVIGLVQVGSQANADRYTYIPLIGIFIAVVFTLHPLLFCEGMRKRIARIAYVTILTLCLFASYNETSFWKNTGLITGRGLEKNKDNYLAYHLIGNIHREYKSYEKAEEFYRKSLELRPNTVQTRMALFDILRIQERYTDVDEELKTVLKIHSDPGKICYFLAGNCKKLGRIEESLEWYGKAVSVENPEPVYFIDYANTLAQYGNLEDALYLYDEAIRLQPDNSLAFHNKASALFSYYHTREALPVVNKALQLQPDYAPSLALLAAIELELSQKQE